MGKGPTGAPLQVVEGPKPTPPEGVPVLPMDEMLAALGTNRPTRLYDLMQSMPHAPQRVRLTAAVLNEIGRIRLAGEALISPPTTREIDQSLLIDGAVSSLITAAGRRGFNTQAVPFLVLVGKGGLAELKLLLASAPQGHEGDPIARLLDQLEKAGRGSVTFRIGEESLSLNVFGFENSERMVDTVVPVCAGVMLWLDDDPDEALLRQIVSKVETARLPAWGVVLAADAQARPAAAGITQSSARWLATLQAPRSLLGLLRLFLPAQAS